MARSIPVKWPVDRGAVVRAPDKRAVRSWPDAYNVADAPATLWCAWTVAQCTPASLASWLLFCPGLHAVFEYWFLSLLATRKMVGGPRTTGKPPPDYEVVVYALDADMTPDPDVIATFRLLSPCDQFHAFSGCDDAAAIAFTDTLVELAVAGRLPPDSDYRREWAYAVSTFQEEMVPALRAAATLADRWRHNRGPV
jgi:hypothetical protein